MSKINVLLLVALPALSLLGYIYLSQNINSQYVRILTLSPIFVLLCYVMWKNIDLKIMVFIRDMTTISLVAGVLFVLSPVVIGFLPKLTESMSFAIGAIVCISSIYWLISFGIYYFFKWYKRITL